MSAMYAATTWKHRTPGSGDELAFLSTSCTSFVIGCYIAMPQGSCSFTGAFILAVGIKTWVRMEGRPIHGNPPTSERVYIHLPSASARSCCLLSFKYNTTAQQQIYKHILHDISQPCSFQAQPPMSSRENPSPFALRCALIALGGFSLPSPSARTRGGRSKREKTRAETDSSATKTEENPLPLAVKFVFFVLGGFSLLSPSERKHGGRSKREEIRAETGDQNSSATKTEGKKPVRKLQLERKKGKKGGELFVVAKSRSNDDGPSAGRLGQGDGRERERGKSKAGLSSKVRKLLQPTIDDAADDGENEPPVAAKLEKGGKDAIKDTSCSSEGGSEVQDQMKGTGEAQSGAVDPQAVSTSKLTGSEERVEVASSDNKKGAEKAKKGAADAVVDDGTKNNDAEGKVIAADGDNKSGGKEKKTAAVDEVQNHAGKEQSQTAQPQTAVLLQTQHGNGTADSTKLDGALVSEDTHLEPELEPIVIAATPTSPFQSPFCGRRDHRRGRSPMVRSEYSRSGPERRARNESREASQVMEPDQAPSSPYISSRDRFSTHSGVDYRDTAPGSTPHNQNPPPVSPKYRSTFHGTSPPPAHQKNNPPVPHRRRPESEYARGQNDGDTSYTSIKCVGESGNIASDRVRYTADASHDFYAGSLDRNYPAQQPMRDRHRQGKSSNRDPRRFSSSREESAEERYMLREPTRRRERERCGRLYEDEGERSARTARHERERQPILDMENVEQYIDKRLAEAYQIKGFEGYMEEIKRLMKEVDDADDQSTERSVKHSTNAVKMRRKIKREADKVLWNASRDIES